MDGTGYWSRGTMMSTPHAQGQGQQSGGQNALSQPAAAHVQAIASSSSLSSSSPSSPSTLAHVRGAKPNRVGRACDRCRRHKIRCGAARPCIHCIRHDMECITTEIEPMSARQTSANARQLQARVARLETVLRDFVSEGDETVVQSALTADTTATLPQTGLAGSTPTMAAAATTTTTAMSAPSPLQGSTHPTFLQQAPQQLLSARRRASKDGGLHESLADDWNPPGAKWQQHSSAAAGSAWHGQAAALAGMPLASDGVRTQQQQQQPRSRTISPKEESDTSETYQSGFTLQWDAKLDDDKAPPLKSDIAPSFEKQPVRYLGDASAAGLLSRLSLLDPELGGKFDPNKGYGLEDPFRSYSRRLGPGNLTVKHLPPRSVCEAYIHHYFRHIQRTTGYVYLHEPTFHRDVTLFWERGTMDFQPTRSAVFLMVLANGANRIKGNTVIESSQEEIDNSDPILAWPKTHKEIGAELFDRAKMFQADMFQSASFVAIYYGLLGMQYLLQVSRSDTAWVFLGMAIREAQALGLHRKVCSWISSGYEEELRRRIWWCLYTSDRLVSFFTGRPLAIHDDDCDVDLPKSYPKGFTFDLSSSVASGFDDFELKLTLISLAQLMGKILRQSYGLKIKHDAEFRHQTFHLLQDLETWHHSIPPALTIQSNAKAINTVEGLHLEVHYLYTKILIMRPLLRKPGVSEDNYGLTRDGAVKMRNELQADAIAATFELIRVVTDLIDPAEAQSHISLQLFAAALGFCIICSVEPKSPSSARQREAIGKAIVWLSRSDLNTAQSGVLILRDMIRVVFARAAAASTSTALSTTGGQRSTPDGPRLGHPDDLPSPALTDATIAMGNAPGLQAQQARHLGNIAFYNSTLHSQGSDAQPVDKSISGQMTTDAGFAPHGHDRTAFNAYHDSKYAFGSGSDMLYGSSRDAVDFGMMNSMSDMEDQPFDVYGLGGFGRDTLGGLPDGEGGRYGATGGGGLAPGQQGNQAFTQPQVLGADPNGQGWMNIDNLGWMWLHPFDSRTSGT